MGPNMWQNTSTWLLHSCDHITGAGCPLAGSLMWFCQLTMGFCCKRRYRDEMVEQRGGLASIKWMPSVASSQKSDELDFEHQRRFDAAVEHAERHGQNDVWPVFYVGF